MQESFPVCWTNSVGNARQDSQCIFPFEYTPGTHQNAFTDYSLPDYGKKVYYDRCTKTDWNQDWCFTRLKENRFSEWGNCVCLNRPRDKFRVLIIEMISILIDTITMYDAAADSLFLALSLLLDDFPNSPSFTECSLYDDVSALLTILSAKIRKYNVPGERTKDVITTSFVSGFERADAKLTLQKVVFSPAFKSQLQKKGWPEKDLKKSLRIFSDTTVTTFTRATNGCRKKLRFPVGDYFSISVEFAGIYEVLLEPSTRSR